MKFLALPRLPQYDALWETAKTWRQTRQVRPAAYHQAAVMP
jgi:hypothetical protein